MTSPKNCRPPEEITGIPAGLQNLTSVVTGLAKRIEELSQQLKPVLLDSDPSAGETCDDGPCLCEHHQNIEAEVGLLNALDYQIVDLRNRLRV